MPSTTERVRAERARQVGKILDQLRAGPSPDDAFRRLFDLYYSPLRGFFANRGFAPEECLDLTQETLLGIYTGIGSFRGEAGFDTWLFKIATNTYRRRLRRRAAGKRAGEEMSLDQLENPDGAGGSRYLAADAELPDGELLHKERVRLLSEAVARLPEQMRRCLVLRVDQALKYQEIAIALRISVQTVKAHLFQARRRVKQELGPYFDPDLSGLDEETS